MEYNNTRRPHILVLIIIISFASLTSSFISPSLPYMVSYFQVHDNDVQNVVTYFVLGYLLGQLVYAPLIKGFGIKKTLNLGILICLLGTIGCYVSYLLNNFTLLKYSRLITGMGAGCGFVTIYSTINNIYQEKEARRITSYTSLSFVVVPGVLMVFSGLIITYFGWQHCFTFLALWCYLIYILGKTLPETAPNAHITNIHIRPLLRNYRSVLSAKVLVYGLMYGVVASVFYIYVATGSFIVITELKQTPEYFSIRHLIVMTGYILGGLYSIKTHHKYTTRKSIFIGCVVLSIASVILSIVHQFKYFDTPVLFFILFGSIYFSVPMLFSNITIILLANTKEKFTVSSILGFLHLVPPLIFLRIMGTSTSPSELLPLVLCMISATLMLLHGVTRKKKVL